MTQAGQLWRAWEHLYHSSLVGVNTQHTFNTAGAKENVSTSVGQLDPMNHVSFYFYYKYVKAKITRGHVTRSKQSN